MSDQKGDKQPDIQAAMAELNSAVNVSIENTDKYYSLVSRLDYLNLDSDLKAVKTDGGQSPVVPADTILARLRMAVNMLNTTNSRNFEILQRFKELV